MGLLVGLSLCNDSINEPRLQRFLVCEFLSEQHHIPQTFVRGVLFADDRHHPRRKRKPNVHLVAGKESLLSNKDVVMGEGEHAAACYRRPSDKSDGRDREDSNSPQEIDEFQDEETLVLWLETCGVLQVEPTAEEFGERDSDEGGCSFGLLDLVQHSVDVPDEGVGEAVGLCVEKQVIHLPPVLQDDTLLQILRTHSQRLLDLVNHRQDLFITHCHLVRDTAINNITDFQMLQIRDHARIILVIVAALETAVLEIAVLETLLHCFFCNTMTPIALIQQLLLALSTVFVSLYSCE